MSRIENVRAAMMQAMKEHDKERKEALSLLLSALKNKAIDKRADLTEDSDTASYVFIITALLSYALEILPVHRL